MSPYRVDLQDWLSEVFPTGFRDTDSISRVLTGLEEHASRNERCSSANELDRNRASVGFHLQCSFDHAAQTKNEGLAWMLVKILPIGFTVSGGSMKWWSVSALSDLGYV